MKLRNPSVGGGDWSELGEMFSERRNRRKENNCCLKIEGKRREMGEKEIKTRDKIIQNKS